MEVGTTPVWSGPAFATGGAAGSETVIVQRSVLLLPAPLPVTVSVTV